MHVGVIHKLLHARQHVGHDHLFSCLRWQRIRKICKVEGNSTLEKIVEFGTAGNEIINASRVIQHMAPVKPATQ